MNWIYVVTWTLLTWHPLPCPDAGKTDQYGRRTSYGCLVNHGGFSGVQKSANFEHREDAIGFMTNAGKSNIAWSHNKLSDFKLDSIPMTSKVNTDSLINFRRVRGNILFSIDTTGSITFPK